MRQSQLQPEYRSRLAMLSAALMCTACLHTPRMALSTQAEAHGPEPEAFDASASQAMPEAVAQPLPLPDPPIEQLYAQYPQHFLGVADACHPDPDKRRQGAETKARHRLARSIRVQVASELTWLRHEERSLTTDQGTLQETFCKTYLAWVDEPLPKTGFTVLVKYINAHGIPCIQGLAVLSYEDWATRLTGYAGLRSDQTQKLQQLLQENPRAHQAALYEQLGLPARALQDDLVSPCLTESTP